jgi:hypothetical protein
MFMCCKEEAFLAGCEDQEAKERSGTLPRAIPIRTPTIRSRATQSKRRLVDFRPTRQTRGPSREGPRSTKPLSSLIYTYTRFLSWYLVDETTLFSKVSSP